MKGSERAKENTERQGILVFPPRNREKAVDPMPRYFVLYLVCTHMYTPFEIIDGGSFLGCGYRLPLYHNSRLCICGEDGRKLEIIILTYFEPPRRCSWKN